MTGCFIAGLVLAFVALVVAGLLATYGEFRAGNPTRKEMRE